MFYHLPNLQVLDLSFNQMTILSSDHGLKSNLKMLVLSHNSIEEINENRNADIREKKESFNTGPLRTFRSNLWDLLEYPETSRAAQMIAFTSIIFVILSTLSFIAESFFEDYIASNVEEKLNKELWSNHGYFEKDGFLILMSCSFYSCL